LFRAATLSPGSHAKIAIASHCYVETVGGQEQWQVDGTAPELYQRYLVPAMTALWAADLVELAALQPGDRVLDAACGTGVVARVAAARVGVIGRVVALDVNPGMLAVARSLPVVAGASVEWREGSVLALSFADDAFDVVLCQFGLQFFADRSAALRELRRVLAPAGRLAVNVFGPIEHNPATNALADALDRLVDPAASLAKRTEHALADAEELRTLIVGAGFDVVVIRTARQIVRFPSAASYVQIQLTATPLATLIDKYQPDARSRLVAALVEDVGVALAPYTGPDGLAVPQEVHALVATRLTRAGRDDRPQTATGARTVCAVSCAAGTHPLSGGVPVDHSYDTAIQLFSSFPGHTIGSGDSWTIGTKGAFGICCSPTASK
jgi:ubiquinone/menaquinone biosynthesis C-methylase UbiE